MSVLPDRVQVQRDARGERLPVVNVQDQVVGHREITDQAVFLPVLRDIADPRAQSLPRCRIADVVAVDVHRPGCGRPQADQCLAELGLPVALHAGHAEDLACPHFERHVVHGRLFLFAGHREAAHVQHDLARPGRRLANPQLHGPAHHQLGKLGIRRGRRALADDLAAPDDRDRVGDRLHLFQLVRDEYDRPAACPELAHDPEQVLGLARRQHGGGLVQHEHAGLAQQGLDDLYPLLHADREILDVRVGVDVQAVALGEFPDVPAGLPPVEQAEPPGALQPEGDILGHREDRDQHEMLVHHADPGGDRVLGRPDGHGLAVEPYLALVRLHQPVEDVHQRRLAGAVLAEQGADLAGLDGQVDVVIGHEAAEPLGDAAQFQLHRQPPPAGTRAPRARRTLAASACMPGARPAASPRAPAVPGGASAPPGTPVRLRRALRSRLDRPVLDTGLDRRQLGHDRGRNLRGEVVEGSKPDAAVGQRAEVVSALERAI